MRVQNADSMGNDIFVINDVVSNADTAGWYYCMVLWGKWNKNQMFYNQNHKNLKDGVIVHGNSEYEEGMQLTEMGCTKVILSGNGDIPRDNPNDRVVHYSRGKET